MRRFLLSLCACWLLPFSFCKNSTSKKTDDPQLSRIHLPPGFRISYWARDVEDARSLALGDKGTVFVGNRSGDKVFALRDSDNDGEADEKFTLMSGGNMPNGVAFHDGALYVTEVDKIWRFDDIESHLSQPPQRVLVFDSLPDKKHHGWKYIAFGPDGKLYVPVGAPCNNCDDAERDARFASICRMNANGSGFEVFAHGIRNTVGFDWHPQTQVLWFTDNGRDELGDNIPPDELNAAPHAGMHFGYPYCHGGDIADPEYGKRHSCTEFTPPVAKLGPHVAALGMKFYTGKMFPGAYRNAIFIAEHGSWNRSQPIGYRLTVVRMKDGQAVYETFAEGWLQNGKAWGRPVAVLQLPDGSLLLSDDFADCIYRISFEGKRT